MAKDYDVIVVGAGNGGLMAAAKLAKDGYKVLVLEKHNIPGGSASSFRRGRFEFEPSLHELCGVGTKEDPGEVMDMFNDIGVDLDWTYEDVTFRAIVEGKDGFDVTLRAGIDNFCDDMEKYVPGSRDSVKAFFETNEKVSNALKIMSGNGKVSDLLKGAGDFMRTASHSAEDVERALGMPQKAMDILNTYWCYLGVPTDELNAMHYMSMVGTYTSKRPAMPKKRSHEISLAIEKKIEEYGGEVWYNSEVVEFLYDNDGRCVGVKTVDGKELKAKQIVSNVIPHNVYSMSDSKNVPERELKLANSRKFGITFITIYLGLDCTKEELGVHDYTVFKSACANPREQFNKRLDGAYYVVNCLNVPIKDASPEGTSMLFFTVPMYGDELPSDLTAENYKKWKNEKAQWYIKDYERVMGIDIMNHIEEIAVATPVTFARYLGTPCGEIYGYETSDWDNVAQRTTSKGTDYTVKGLYYCGGHDIRGDGYSSAYTSGYQAATAVEKRIEKGE